MSRLWQAEFVLPVTIAAAALALGISEFMTTFQFGPPGGDPLREVTAADRHGYAMLLLAAFALISMIIAVVGGLRMAAWATAGFGVAALVLFLVIDLPDVNELGDIEDPNFGLASARADPQLGFWLEAVGAVVLGLASVAFATLGSEQLQAPRRWFESRRRHADSGPEDPKQRNGPTGKAPRRRVDSEQAPGCSVRCEFGAPQGAQIRDQDADKGRAASRRGRRAARSRAANYQR